MTAFDQHALDGGRPDYAPGLSATKGFFYWRAPRPALAAGYALKRAKLPGSSGDGADLERARLCRDMTREALRWLDQGDTTIFSRDTWGWLIQRYLTDELSPYREVKANTRDTYAWHMGRWQEMVGNTFVATTTYAVLKGWQKLMKDKGRSPVYIKRMFVHLRIAASYGAALRIVGARDVKEVLAEMRFAGARPRTAAPTSDQIAAIIAKADEAGETSFALGLSLQWWLALRAVDVRGQWLRMAKGEIASGIIRGGFRWADGLTWDMIDRDAGTLTKTPSKTEDVEALQEPLVFDLTLIPDVRTRLLAMPSRVGPVIVDRNGMPYRKESWSALFRKFRAAAEVPDTIWMMDTRAGAINDAKRKGASPIELQHQANHASLSTTNRYIRERSESANRVIQMRSN
jgi:integrase